jgi:hypothetical protein
MHQRIIAAHVVFLVLQECSKSRCSDGRWSDDLQAVWLKLFTVLLRLMMLLSKTASFKQGTYLPIPSATTLTDPYSTTIVDADTFVTDPYSNAVIDADTSVTDPYSTAVIDADTSVTDPYSTAVVDADTDTNPSSVSGSGKRRRVFDTMPLVSVVNVDDAVPDFSV